jgi:glyoxylase-like metal-dependent hydrolase (beta-lactamase superfamily II)
MKEIADKVYIPKFFINGKDRRENNISAVPVVIEGNTSLILYDCGCESYLQLKNKRNTKGTFIPELLRFSKEIGKTVKHVFFSHEHGDHTLDALFLRKAILDIEFLGHKNNRAPYRDQRYVGICLDVLFDEDVEMEVDGVALQVLMTPGHNSVGDDISLFLADKGLMCTGDIVQPNGLSYERAIFPNLPYYSRGDDYLSSLAKIISLKPKLIQTAHSGTLNGTTETEINRLVVLRTKQLAQSFIQDQNAEGDIARLIFDTIAEERGVPLRSFAPNTRKIIEDFYKTHDIYGLNYFVNKARKEFNLSRR